MEGMSWQVDLLVLVMFEDVSHISCFPLFTPPLPHLVICYADALDFSNCSRPFVLLVLMFPPCRSFHEALFVTHPPSIDHPF